MQKKTIWMLFSRNSYLYNKEACVEKLTQLSAIIGIAFLHIFDTLISYANLANTKIIMPNLASQSLSLLFLRIADVYMFGT